MLRFFPLFVLGCHELGNFKNLHQLWRSAVNWIPCKCVTFIICKIKSCHKCDPCLLNRRWGFSLCVIWSQRVFFCLPVSCVGNYKWKSSGKFRRAHVATWHKDPFRWEAGEISVRREECTASCSLAENGWVWPEISVKSSKRDFVYPVTAQLKSWAWRSISESCKSPLCTGLVLPGDVN